MIRTFQNLKIQGKLLAIFGSIIFIGVLITGWTILSINILDKLAYDLIKVEGELSEALKTKNTLQEMALAELSYVLSHDEEFIHAHERLNTHIDLFLRNAVIRAESATIQAILFEFEREKQAYDVEIEKLVEAAEEGDWETAVTLGEESARRMAGMITEVDKMVQLHQPLVDAQVALSNQQVLTSSIVGGASLLVFLGLALGAAVVVSNQVTQPILAITQAAGAVEAGNFDPQSLRAVAYRTDEVGHLSRAFIQMAEEAQARNNALQEQADQIRIKLG